MISEDPTFHSAADDATNRELRAQCLAMALQHAREVPGGGNAESILSDARAFLDFATAKGWPKDTEELAARRRQLIHTRTDEMLTALGMFGQQMKELRPGLQVILQNFGEEYRDLGRLVE